MIDSERIEQALENSIVKMLNNSNVFEVEYRNRIDVSSEIKKAYSSIDFSKVQQKITERLEEVLAKKIVDKMLTEMNTDIKKMMSSETVREDLRFLMRKGVEEIMSKVREEKEEN